MTELLRAWQRWDAVMAAMPRHPGARYGEKEANAMQAACRDEAARLGIGCSVLRSGLAAARREGLSHMDALARMAQ